VQTRARREAALLLLVPPRTAALLAATCLVALVARAGAEQRERGSRVQRLQRRTAGRCASGERLQQALPPPCSLRLRSAQHVRLCAVLSRGRARGLHRPRHSPGLTSSGRPPSARKSCRRTPSSSCSLLKTGRRLSHATSYAHAEPLTKVHTLTQRLLLPARVRGRWVGTVGGEGCWRCCCCP
jgi:hypothetical protein